MPIAPSKLCPFQQLFMPNHSFSMLPVSLPKVQSDSPAVSHTFSEVVSQVPKADKSDFSAAHFSAAIGKTRFLAFDKGRVFV